MMMTYEEPTRDLLDRADKIFEIRTQKERHAEFQRQNKEKVAQYKKKYMLKKYGERRPYVPLPTDPEERRIELNRRKRDYYQRRKEKNQQEA